MEAVVALAICTLLFMLLLAVFGSFQKMSNFQQSGAELESQLLLGSQIIEKDLRHAGFGIPGNGLFLRNYGARDFSLAVLSNEENAQTTLSRDAGSGVCLCRDSTVRYYPIGRVGRCNGADTVVLEDAALTDSWGQDPSRVYFAKGIEYGVKPANGKNVLVRTAPATSIVLGAAIDSFAVRQKIPAAGVTGDFSRTRTLRVTIGGRVGPAGKRVAVTRTFDVEIRNSR
jgi:hypothetical protein